MASFLIGLSCNLPTDVKDKHKLYIADLTYCLADTENIGMEIPVSTAPYLYLSNSTFITEMYILLDQDHKELKWNDKYIGHASTVLIHQINWKKQQERYMYKRYLEMTG